jgi:hypothetical protein
LGSGGLVPKIIIGKLKERSYYKQRSKLKIKGEDMTKIEEDSV